MPKTNKNKYSYRGLSLRLQDDGTPKTIDIENRSVDVLASTENPVEVFDFQRWEMVNEVLLMSGCKMASRQIPLLDSHSRYDTSSVIGSFRNMTIAGGELTGRAFFSAVDKVADTWTKVREGHLTDFSVGYSVNAATWIEDGQTAVIDGRDFSGPLRVVTDWKVKELSVCSIGADEQAKARAEARPQQKEVKDVEKKLRAFLERQGLPQDANEKEAYTFLERMEVPKTEPKKEPEKPDFVDVEGERKQATSAERTRIAEISAMGRKFDCDEIAVAQVESGATVDEARKAIMDKISDTEVKHRSPAEVGTEDHEKFRAAGESAIMFRAGFKEEKPAEFEDLAGRSLVDLARMSLIRSGMKDNGRPLEVVGRAMVTGDFPLMLTNVANKAHMQGWENTEETWRQWCGTGSVSDFKIQTMVRPSETDDLDEIPEGTEYKYGDRTEQKEEYNIATYGKMFALTRQVIVNDDLSALTDIPAMHGEAASRKLGDIAYSVLTANAAMGDGTALFHADHSNIGTGSAVDVDSIQEAIFNMKTQKDIKDIRRLNIRPVFFIAPVAIEGSSEMFFNTGNFAATGDTDALIATLNPYAGSYFTRIYEPRLDDDSATAWYFAGAQGRTVVMYFLDGVQAPYMETKQGWSVDGVEYKVRLDAGAKAKDWKGLSTNAGV